LNRHEIPTHLNVEDKAFAGLTMRQLMTVAVGLGLAYGAASELPLPMPAQAAVAIAVLTFVAVLTLWRPAGRPLEDWAFILLRYWAIPRVAVWRTRHRPEEKPDEEPAYEVVLPDALWGSAGSLTANDERDFHATR